MNKKLQKRLEQLRKEDERHRKKINKLFDELEEIIRRRII